jgi:hypothetical protein
MQGCSFSHRWAVEHGSTGSSRKPPQEGYLMTLSRPVGLWARVGLPLSANPSERPLRGRWRARP